MSPPNTFDQATPVIELPQLPTSEPRTCSPPRTNETEVFKGPTDDERRLMRLGKQPVLKRDFGFMSVLGFSCTVLITWEGAVILSTSALFNGGPAGVLWGFLINWLGILSAFASIAELASMAPVSGGQFHWISLLASPSAHKFLSYLTGWVTVLGWQAVTLSSAFLCSGTFSGTITLLQPSFAPKPWQSMLITWAVLAFAVLINASSSRALARFEGVILVVHIAGFFGVLVPLVYYGPHGNASIFTTLYNGGGWRSNGVSFLVGLPSLVYSLFGADSAIHIAEEVQNASRVVPQALMLSLCINGALGFAMLMGLMFCLGNLDAALFSDYAFSYIEIFEQAVRSRGGAAAMSLIIISIGVCATVGALAATTRLLWAFARENGVPFSKVVGKVHPRSKLPLNAVLVSVTFEVLILLISLGSSLALKDTINLSIAGLFSSYLIVCIALLYRRLQGKIKEHDNETNIRGPGSLRWGPWRIPEPLGTINNSFACLFLAWTLLWTFFPSFMDVTPSTMNYNVPVFSVTVLGSIVWYLAVGRKTYVGPIVEF